jgi:hypothetical protein
MRGWGRTYCGRICSGLYKNSPGIVVGYTPTRSDSSRPHGVWWRSAIGAVFGTSVVLSRRIVPFCAPYAANSDGNVLLEVIPADSDLPYLAELKKLWLAVRPPCDL